jgi:hypothetical protein
MLQYSVNFEFEFTIQSLVFPFLPCLYANHPS